MTYNWEDENIVDRPQQRAYDEWVADQERRAEEFALREERADALLDQDWGDAWDSLLPAAARESTPVQNSNERMFLVTARWEFGVIDEMDIDSFETLLEPMTEMVMYRFPGGTRLYVQELEVGPAP